MFGKTAPCSALQCIAVHWLLSAATQTAHEPSYTVLDFGADNYVAQRMSGRALLIRLHSYSSRIAQIPIAASRPDFEGLQVRDRGPGAGGERVEVSDGVGRRIQGALAQVARDARRKEIQPR